MRAAAASLCCLFSLSRFSACCSCHLAGTGTHPTILVSSTHPPSFSFPFYTLPSNPNLLPRTISIITLSPSLSLACSASPRAREWILASSAFFSYFFASSLLQVWVTNAVIILVVSSFFFLTMCCSLCRCGINRGKLWKNSEQLAISRESGEPR